MLNQMVEILWAARFDYHKSSRLQIHNHEYDQIIHILEGSGRFYLNGVWNELGRGATFFIKSNVEHGLEVDQDGTAKTLDIKFIVNDADLEQRLQNLPGYTRGADEKILRLLEGIRSEGIERKGYFQEFSRLYLLEILYTLIRLEEKLPAEQTVHEATELPPVHGSVSAHIKKYLMKHYMDEVHLETISAALGYHKGYMCQMFKKCEKVSIMKFLYDFRIAKSKELLIYSDYTIKDIAEKTGFKTIHHYTHRFRQKEGTTPAELRQKEREGIRKDIVFTEDFGVSAQFTKAAHEKLEMVKQRQK